MESISVQAVNLVIFAFLMTVEGGGSNLRVMYPQDGKSEVSALTRGNV